MKKKNRSITSIVVSLICLWFGTSSGQSITVTKPAAKDSSKVFTAPPEKTLQYVKITNPEPNSEWMVGKTYTIRWESKCGPSNDGFDVAVVGYPSKKLVYKIKSGGFPSSERNKFYYEWNIPYAEDLPTGYYEIRVTSWLNKCQAHSGTIRIAREVKTTEHAVNPIIYNRYFSRCLKNNKPKPCPGEDYFDVQGLSNIPDRARVGYLYFYGESDEYYVGRVFRSKLLFPVAKYKDEGQLLEAHLVIHRQENKLRNVSFNSCAEAIFVLNAEWDWGNASSNPGYVLKAMGNKDYWYINAFNPVSKWIKGTQPNHGLLFISRDENFDKVYAHCVSYYHAYLKLKFKKEKDLTK